MGGSDSTFRNSYSGWYTSGNTVTSGNGKRAAYDTLALTGLKFSDASGRYIEYRLSCAYSGKTLLGIVQQCMGSDRSNTNSATWRSGHCTIGTHTSSNSVSGYGSLRIGVGDGHEIHGEDWALFMPLTGNGGGDFAGNNIWSFGSEYRLNNGYGGIVTISGVTSTASSAVREIPFCVYHRLLRMGSSGGNCSYVLDDLACDATECVVWIHSQQSDCGSTAPTSQTRRISAQAKAKIDGQVLPGQSIKGTILSYGDDELWPENGLAEFSHL